MERRSTPWVWIIAFVVLLMVVAVVAYWFGAGSGHHVVAFRMFPRFGLGILGFVIPLLILALLVGLAVAALAPSSRRAETFEEWHQRAHGQGAAEPPVALPAAPPMAEGDSKPAESGPSDQGT